jgi:histidine triad (HIT) family protein
MKKTQLDFQLDPKHLARIKKEVDKIFDLDEATYNGLMQFSRTVAIALKKAMPCERIGISVIGLEVPHAHVHLIPLHSMDDARFIKKTKLSTEEFQELAEDIKAHL